MTDPSEHDDELVARLRAADPASRQRPVAPDLVARLLEETMTDDVPDESRATGTRRRGPLTWLVAAAAAAVVAGAVLFLVVNADDAAVTTSASESGSPTSGQGTVTELAAPDDSPARCMTPSAELMADNEVAFDGTVESVEDDRVTLAVSRWYAGRRTDRVVVRAPGEAMQALVGAVAFEEGDRYLVTSSDGERLMVCGFSAPYSASLAAMYVEAFGG